MLINFFYNALHQVLTLVFPLITTPYITRIFTPEQLGKYSVSASIVNIFVVLSSYSLANYGVREIAKCSNNEEALNKIFSELTVMNVIITVLSLVIFGLCDFIFKFEKVLLIQSALIFINLIDFIWFYVGIGKLQKLVVRNFITKIVLISLIFIFVKTKEDFLLYVLLNILSFFIGNVITIIDLKQYIRFKPVKLKRVIYHINASKYLFVPIIVATIYSSLDRILVSFILGNNEVGLYDQSQKLLFIITTFVSSVNIILMPQMCKKLQVSESSLQVMNSINIIIEYILFIVLYVFAMYFSLCKMFSMWFFGKSFSLVGELMQFSSILILLIPLNKFMNDTLLVSFNKDKEILCISLLRLVTMIIAFFLLGHFFGIQGIIISLIFIEIFIGVILHCINKQVIGISTVLIKNYKSIISVSIILLMNEVISSVFKVKINIGNTFILGIGYTFVYCIILLFLKEEKFKRIVSIKRRV